MELDDLLLQCYLNDGYGEEEANSYITVNRQLFSEFIRDVNIRSARDINRSHLEVYVDKSLMRALPYFSEHLPDFSQIKFDKLFSDLGKGPLKYLLRFFEFFVNHIDMSKLLSKKLNFADPEMGEPFALYLDKLLDLGKTTDKIIKKIYETGNILPALARVPDLFSEWLYGPAQRNLSIQSVRHVDEDTGQCSALEYGHTLTLFNTSSPHFNARVLVYSRDDLLGSVKMFGDNSLLAMTTIKAYDGTYPLVVGGAYALGKDVLAQIKESYSSGERSI